MKAILQRVTDAKVEVDSKTVGEIGTGFLILLGVENGDTEKEADALAAKIAGLRIFTDENDFLFSEGGYFVSAHYHSCERHRIQSESILFIH